MSRKAAIASWQEEWSRPLVRRLHRWIELGLTHRYQPLAVTLLAVGLTLPALSVGWVIDDYFHRSAMVGSGVLGEFIESPADLFRFLDGDPERTRRLIDLGFLPWWTYIKVKAAFWRPLTVLTHWLDYQLWPEIPALMHAQSLLWFGAIVAATALLYRRLMSPVWLAGLAGLLFAIDDAHGMPVGFLANRNALLATFFGVLALSAHDRWRRDGWRYGVVIGPLLLLLSLLSKEAGIATCAYLAAHALFLDRGTWRRRCLALVPYAGVVLVWRAAWSYLGYGVENVGLYVDPLHEPWRYLVSVGQRAPIFLLAQWATPPGEITIVVEPERIRWLWFGAVAFTVALALVIMPLVRHDRIARFWTTGMLLALLPACATFPADRLLFFVGIGAMGLLAQFWHGAFGQAGWRPRRRLWRIPAVALAVLFVVFHVVAAPIALPLRAAHPAGPKFVEQLYIRTPFDDSIAGQDLIVVNPPSVLHTAYFMIEREYAGQPVPRRVRQLASGLQSVTVHRRDAQTLVIRPEEGYLSWVFERLFRGYADAMSVGERVELTGMTIEITELTADGRPAEARFQFAVPLEDRSLRWLRWERGDFVPFAPPAVGETMELESKGPWWAPRLPTTEQSCSSEEHGAGLLGVINPDMNMHLC